MYTIEKNGIKHQVNAKTFWRVAAPAFLYIIALWAWVIWMATIGLDMLNYYTGIPVIVCGIPVLLFLGSVTVQGVRKSLLPEYVQTILAIVLSVMTFYYAYAIENNGWMYMTVMVLPALIHLGHKLLHKK